MVDVFISYSRTNKDKVSQIAKGIEAAGYDVWWDAELPPHQSYGDVITAKIQMAKAAVVVWSAEAAASEWVRAEADVARNQKKLVQTALGDITPPLPFNQIQYANLGDWNGEQDHPEWRKVKASLADLCGPREPAADTQAYTFPAGLPPTPAPAPAPISPAPVAPLMGQPAGDRNAGVQRSGGVPVPVVVGGLVALLGLAGAAWVVSSKGGDDDGGKGDETEQVAAADGDAQGLMAASPDNAPAAAATPAPAPAAPAPAPAAQAPAAAPPQQQQYNRDVRLINQTGDTIMYLRWSDADQSDYGADRLGSDVLGNGQYWDVTIDDGSGACVYDLMATTAGGRDVARNGVNVCSVSSVTFN